VTCLEGWNWMGILCPAWINYGGFSRRQPAGEKHGCNTIPILILRHEIAYCVSYTEVSKLQNPQGKLGGKAKNRWKNARTLLSYIRAQSPSNAVTARSTLSKVGRTCKVWIRPFVTPRVKGTSRLLIAARPTPIPQST